jgi:hypothetical protein
LLRFIEVRPRLELPAPALDVLSVLVRQRRIASRDSHVPVGAVLTRKDIFEKVFDRLDRAVVHGSTFGKNDLAIAAGIATLDVLTSEGLIENAARTGDYQCWRRSDSDIDGGLSPDQT